jgi:hypothetical protein
MWLVVGALMLFPTAARAQVTSIEARVEAFARCPVVPFPTPEADDIRLDSGTPWSPQHVPPDTALHDPASWVARDSDIERHKALRARAGVDMPQGEQQVLLFDGFGHHALTETSLVATRGREGQWRVDALSEHGVSTMQAVTRHQTWILSTADGLALDDWLADPCLDAEPPHSTHTDFALDWYSFWTLETTGRDPKILFERHHMGFGRALRIRSLIERGRPQ